MNISRRGAVGICVSVEKIINEYSYLLTETAVLSYHHAFDGEESEED